MTDAHQSAQIFSDQVAYAQLRTARFCLDFATAHSEKPAVNGRLLVDEYK